MDIEEVHNIEIPHKNKSLSVFHINTCSLHNISMTFNISQIALKNDIITSERRITKQVSLWNNINNYSFEVSNWEFCRCLCTANHLSYKCGNDLNNYKRWIGIYFYWNCQSEKIKYYIEIYLQTSIYEPCRLWL